MNSLIVLGLILLIASYGASRCMLYGVSAWWQCTNSKLDDEELTKQKSRAISLVSTSFMIWSIAIITTVNSMQGAMILGVLQAAGVDISAITKE